jgi:nicotinate dehydrogenase subunit B
VVAIVAEIEIDRRAGKVWARKFTVAHDCGLIVNPDGLRRCIEGNVVQGTSRALSEEVAFDRTKVTSVDRLSYPILDSPFAKARRRRAGAIAGTFDPRR